ncbi:MAG: winged helix-turn-helix domain-containing protein [Sphingopyxis sp.]|uniref:winged helix-turn-helix domain-containing protein n=1 Tax=Sphingopyxis sp. TaxID=1908224 RepID=UPI002ABCCCE1|nr:winged helix-turn-helix domain-containing protein [Sphingopyxis sp.]MDZ3832314.1 winged helix-turn-helix domain-containing protein [Sphingopyxis sp.]
MTSLPARPIELAIEAPFRLRTLEVTPAALELRRGQDVLSLEPRVMQVLVALHRAAGQVVSREELLELCWEGRIVGDDSLNRSVSQLRKALTDEDGVAVETIPRVGYRLRFEADEADVIPAAEAEHAPKRRLITTRTMISTALIAICGIAASFPFFTDAPLSWSASGVRPLTQDAGVETFPAMAPDGLSVAYTAGSGYWEPRDIYLRNVSVGDATPMRLTHTPEADESAPAWSPQGDRVAFLRETADGQCAIIVMAPPNGAERTVAQCTDPSAALAWLNANELIVGNRPIGKRARRLVAVDITSGRSRILTVPPADMLGDASPAVSGRGRWVAFRRTAAMGSDAIYLLDTQSGETRPLTRDGWKAAGFTWAKDERTLFFSSNRGGDFGLWAIDTSPGSEPRRVTLGMLPLGRLSIDRDSRHIAVETGRLRAGLARIGADGGPASSITAGESIDWDPDVRADGTILFASDRSGTNQLWARRPDGRIVRLTDLNASYVYAPRWSPDGNRILFIAVIDGRTDIHAIRPDGSGLVRLTNDGAPKGRASWSAVPDQLFFTAVAGTGWHLRRHDMRTGRSVAVPDSKGIAIVERTGDRLLARRAETTAIAEVDIRSGAIRALPTPIHVAGLETWAPRSDGIAHIRGKGPKAELWLTTWNGNSRLLTPLHPAPRDPFAVADDDSIVTPQLIGDDRDLMLIELK